MVAERGESLSPERMGVRMADAAYLQVKAENERLRAALLSLQAWDMLTLDVEGHGVATDDAPWARALIEAALSGRTEVPDGR